MAFPQTACIKDDRGMIPRSQPMATAARTLWCVFFNILLCGPACRARGGGSVKDEEPTTLYGARPVMSSSEAGLGMNCQVGGCTVQKWATRPLDSCSPSPDRSLNSPSTLLVSLSTPSPTVIRTRSCQRDDVPMAGAEPVCPPSSRPRRAAMSR
jgi:hypothetical protein